MKQSKNRHGISRRRVIAGFAATTLIPTPAVWAQSGSTAGRHRNVSSFRVAQWQDHFETLKNGAILSDTQSKVLQYWSEDQSVYRLYPSSVPLTEDLTRLGYTTIIRKVEGPSWRPTPAMKERNPAWPDYVGPGPENPLGTHALYLSWQYYRIHGTNDTRKIGRKSSNGCIGLYNEQIAELFELATIGTQVKLI
ncbi:L,D-transpeptidase [uncultured Ruegeria sp.]|uniref:L,D-transpeptidase n=1 Tax=uncultured Ruegeria sp. TaxID=259304 RepID=UPI002622F603|nr:L,D-transpeptidase [uncultured Ruegeria sp.]